MHRKSGGTVLLTLDAKGGHGGNRVESGGIVVGVAIVREGLA